MSRDFVEMFSALSAEGARFLVVGAHALAVHGLPRATGDLDLLVEPTPRNAQRVMRALRRFGAPRFGLTEADLCRPDVVFQMGIPPVRIDLLTSISGVGFAQAWRGRTRVRVFGRQVNVLGRVELLRNKRAAGRPKDLVDAQALQRLRPRASRRRLSAAPASSPRASAPASSPASPSRRSRRRRTSP